VTTQTLPQARAQRRPAAIDLSAVPDHRGEARPAEFEFFADPPGEIGRLLSAESTLKTGQAAMSPAARQAVALGTALFVGVATLIVMQQLYLRALGQLIAVPAGLLAGAIALFFTRFRRSCTYVGEDGVARFDLVGPPDTPLRSQVLPFARAAALRASQTRHYTNGIYTNTSYNHEWTDAAGKSLFDLSGTYHGKNKPPPAGDAYHFAAAAEVAWSIHYLGRALEELGREGAIAFPIDRGRVVRVAPGYMEFDFGEGPVRVTASEMAKVTLGDGEFSFIHKDAKWYRSAGKYRFSYSTMANGRVFVLALNKLMGYKWS
jgi:hypothetical protein